MTKDIYSNRYKIVEGKESRMVQPGVKGISGKTTLINSKMQYDYMVQAYYKNKKANKDENNSKVMSEVEQY